MSRPAALLLMLIPFALAPAAADASLPGIHSPTGNIRCVFVPGPPAGLLCTLRHADYAAALQAHCENAASLDWHGFQLSAATKGAIVCSGGILITQRVRFANLPYGKTWRHAMFTCTSAVTGVTCRSRAGHGLFLSRQSWRVF